MGSSTAEAKEDCAERSAGGTRMPNHRKGSPNALLSLVGVLFTCDGLVEAADSAAEGLSGCNEALWESADAWVVDPDGLGADLSMAETANAASGPSAVKHLYLSTE